EETLTNPSPETHIQPGDTLVVLGSRAACRELDGLAAGETDPESDEHVTE
ncbi:MAG TPA: TrkA C-terminal domain-containing protein, partial [Halococcus sp.]|nr:TrkA C-terminal domain-containing protein [Halococcus sp.]